MRSPRPRTQRAAGNDRELDLLGASGCRRVEVASGRSSLTAWVSSGAVRMKITSSTSITSISGTMLISAMGAAAPCLLKPPNAITPLAMGRGGLALPFLLLAEACGPVVRITKEGRVVGEGVEACHGDAIGACEAVVADDGGQGDGQAEAGHDECLTDRAGNFVECARARHADGNQRAIHTPYGAEQPDERRRRAHGRQHGEAVLEMRLSPRRAPS